MSKSLSISLFIVIIAAGLMWFISTKKSEAPSVPNQPVTAVSHCGLTINAPLPQTVVSGPISISAVVDNTNMDQLGCSWTVFEAQAGTIELKDSNGTLLGFGLLTTTSDWMTTAPVTYIGMVTPTAPIPSGTQLSLIFTEENPSGEGIPDTLTVPVTAQ
jgi:hypothetical protein